MNEGCTNNEFGGRYHMVQTQKSAIILDVRIRWSVRVEVWRLWQRKWQMWCKMSSEEILQPRGMNGTSPK